MRVETLGDGAPEVAVVGGIHGDEPSGVRAIERVLEANPDVDRPVAFIIANERALDAGVRYIDEDLNRAFPGDPDADTHEGRLAAELLEVVDGCTVLSLHSTQSHPEPFAIVTEINDLAREIVPKLPVESVVTSAEFSQGRLLETGDVIEVEAGHQGSERAAYNAEALVWAFLQATGVLSEPVEVDGAVVDTDATRADNGSRPLPVYRLSRLIPKSEAETYELLTPNFERVDVGDVFAAIDDEGIVADEPFYPVLMSEEGYERIFGYAAERIDVLEAT